MRDKIIVIALVFIAISLCGCTNISSIQIPGLWSSSASDLHPTEPYNATIISDNVPANMLPGKSNTVSITVENTGYTPWSSGHMVSLVPANNSDAVLFNSSSLTIGPNATVITGSDYTWNIEMVAPSYSGNYTLEYQLKDSNDTVFGETLARNMTVGDQNSLVVYLSQEYKWYPPIQGISIPRDTWQNVSITVKNMGRFNWSDKDQVHLGTVDYEPNKATQFNPTLLFYIGPDGLVRPGEQCVWKFKLHAPSDPGSYLVEYRMKKGDEWFGKTLRVDITVI